MKRPKYETLGNHLNWLLKANMLQESVREIEEYFNDPDVFEWDFHFQEVVDISLKISIKSLKVFPKLFSKMIQLSTSQEKDLVPKLFLEHVQNCRMRISDDQIVLGESKKLIKISIPYKYYEEHFLTPSINYLICTVESILTILQEYKEYIVFYYQLLNLSYDIALEYSSSKFLEVLNSKLEKSLEIFDINIQTELLMIDTLFKSYSTNKEFLYFEESKKYLGELSVFLSTFTSPLEKHEEFLIEKIYLQELLSELYELCKTLNELYSFYDTSPITSSIPKQYLQELSLISILSSPIINDNNKDKDKERKEIIFKLLLNVRHNSLRRLAISMEKHNDMQEICETFQIFSNEFEIKKVTPKLYQELQHNAAQRALQSIIHNDTKINMKIDEILGIIQWINENELNSLLIEGNENNLYKCKIDMIHNTINVLE